MVDIECLLEDMNEYCIFDGELNEDSFYDKVVAPLMEDAGYKFQWNEGSSKGVLIFPDWDYVIKIPFTSDGQGIGFQKAPMGGIWDFCYSEMKFYEKAVSIGIQALFAETACIGYIYGHPIYTQPIITLLEDVDEEEFDIGSLEEETIIMRAIREEGNSIPVDSFWAKCVIKIYGEFVFRTFLNFIADYAINDLHDENVGYDGFAPICSDYSGFFSNSAKCSS